MRRATWTAAPISTLCAALAVAALGTSPPQCPGADGPCAILESDDVVLLSGPGEIALRRRCGLLPAAAVAEASVPQAPAPGPAGAAAGATDVQVNRIPDAGRRTTQSEVSLAQTGGVLVAGWNDTSDVTSARSIVGYAVSTDGGASWADRGALLPIAPVTSVNLGDPWIRAHHASGNFYFATIAQRDRPGPLDRFIVAVYTDATPGVAPDWPAVKSVTPNQPLNSFQDKEAMDVDNSGGPFDGRVYVCWRQFGGTHNIKLSISDTAGRDAPLANRSIADMNPPGRGGQGCFVEVDQGNGDVYVAWEDFAAPRSIRVRRSPAGGEAFGAEAEVAFFPPVGKTTTCVPCDGRQVMNGDIRVLEFISSMAVNPASGNLHAVYAAGGVGGDLGDVFHVRCSPIGVDAVGNCTPPFQLNSDGTSTDQWHPYIDASPGGDLAVFWYDRRNDPADNLMIDVYRRLSLDDGETFTPDERVTDVSFGVPPLCPNFDSAADCYMGEYNHITSDASSFYFLWGDNRNLVDGRPDPDVFFEAELLNRPPDCAAAAPDPEELWPPNHMFWDVSVHVPDPEGDPVEVSITSVFQDEPVNDLGDGNTTPDALGLESGALQLRAERSGEPELPGDGRVYRVGFVAEDDRGARCHGEVTVCVRHDQLPGNECVDQGALFDSTLRD